MKLNEIAEPQQPQLFDERGFRAVDAYDPELKKVEAAAKRAFVSKVVPAFKQVGGQYADHRAAGTGSANGYDMTADDVEAFNAAVSAISSALNVQADVIPFNENPSSGSRLYSQAFWEFNFRGASTVVRLDLTKNVYDGAKYKISLYAPTVGWPSYYDNGWQPKGIQK